MTKLVTAALALDAGGWRADWAIAVDEGRIAATGPADELAARFPDATVESWGEVAVLPGGVNGHGHTFQALVRGFGDDLAFGDWMGGLVHPVAAGLDRAAIKAGARFDFAEMARCGITTAVDFFNLHDGGNDNALAVVEAAEDVGLRTVIARCMFDAESGPPRYRETPAEYAAHFDELLDALRDSDRAWAQPAPHSVLGASAEMLQLGAEIARAHGLPLHVHVADNWGERETSLERFGATPVGYLDRLGVLDENLLAVHAVAIDDDDVALLADAGAWVVHNPSTNAFLGGGIAPLAKLRERGVPVCLGTDAAGANSRQSLFEEMRMASLLAKATTRDATVVTAADVLAMGTRAGGEALHLPVGSIAPGFFADLVAVDLDALSMQPRATATQNVVYSMQPEAIARVVVGGEPVCVGGELVRADVAEIAADVNRLAARWTPLTGEHPGAA